MPFFRFFALLSLFWGNLANAESLSSYRYKIAGDILQFFPSTFATTLNYMEKDDESNKLLLKSVLGGMVLTNALKLAMNDSPLGTRPNGGALSFPSGHTSFACTGAAFINERHKRTHALIALNIAAFVGYSRIKAKKHHRRDVIFGCTLSFAVNKYFVPEKRRKNLFVYPTVGQKYFGLLLNYHF